MEVNLKEHLNHAALPDPSHRIELSLSGKSQHCVFLFNATQHTVLSYRYLGPCIIPSLRVKFFRLRTVWFRFLQNSQHSVLCLGPQLQLQVLALGVLEVLKKLNRLQIKFPTSLPENLTKISLYKNFLDWANGPTSDEAI